MQRLWIFLSFLTKYILYSAVLILMRRLAVVVRPPVSLAVTVHVTLVGRPASVMTGGQWDNRTLNV